MEHWYLVCHKKGKHNAYKAQMFLSGIGITVFIPQVLYPRLRLDRPGYFRNRLELLFPGYLFVFFDYSVHCISKVACSPGISHFVRFGGSIRPIHDTMVDEFMRFTLTASPDDLFKNKREGDARKCHQGNADSLTEEQRNKLRAIVHEINGDKRSALLYTFMDATQKEYV